MTREQFIKKWLANPQKQYTEYFKDEMREDLDLVIKMTLKEPNVIESVCSCSKGNGIDHDEDGKAYCIDCGNYLEQTVP